MAHIIPEGKALRRTYGNTHTPGDATMITERLKGTIWSPPPKKKTSDSESTRKMILKASVVIEIRLTGVEAYLVVCVDSGFGIRFSRKWENDIF